MSKRKRDKQLEITAEIAAHLDFTEISDGKTFYKKVCQHYAQSCGKSKHKAMQRDEEWWRTQEKNGFKLPYFSTPAAERRARAASGSVTPIAERPQRSRYGRYS